MFVAAGLLYACWPPIPRTSKHSDLPKPVREFRGVWVATVANIDWPSAPGLPSQKQRMEAIKLLDRCHTLKLNAVILQVRPQCDLFYPSNIEPWSYFLSGEQGKPPDPPYDPLEFWIEESHARGLELHAWVNPFRANHPKHHGKFSPQSIAMRRPDFVLPLGNEGYYWLDPGHPQARDHTMAVISEIVERYDVDGIHLDDYFYPYPSYNNNVDFPDQISWTRYITEGGSLSRSDWRRKNVNNFVRNLYEQIKLIRPTIKVGLSPFGIWRPGHPADAIAGIDQYEQLFADARLWWQQGWLDYFVPQLYWRISSSGQSFPELLTWWKHHNNKDRHLWPGLYTSKVIDSQWPIDEIPEQIALTRNIIQDSGHVHFSIQSLLGKDGPSKEFALKLATQLYQLPALVPSSPWLDDVPPAAPIVSQPLRLNGRIELSWRRAESEEAFLHVVYSKTNKGWNYEIVPGTRRSHSFFSVQQDMKWEAFAVSSVDHAGNESQPAIKSADTTKTFD